KEKKPLTRLTETLRLEYYNLAIRILSERRQIIPCYGGISNIHLNFDGELWPCCVLGYDYPLGNLRENGYNVQSVMRSTQARRVLRHIHRKRCHCPLANQWYSNILLHPITLGRVIFRYFMVDISK
ncbi:SPASM domain-containing protein, partial [bacterium]|nr:SPASM domain-containing protein [bacterium]